MRWYGHALLAVPLMLHSGQLLWMQLVDPFLLGPDPGEILTDWLGSWALWGLMLTLAISPLASLSKRWRGRVNWPSVRRACGLWTFSYALMHLCSYQLFLSAGIYNLLEDLQQRPYIIIGFFALLVLFALAVTSTRSWQRRLRLWWKRLHRLVYLAAPLVVLHVFMQSRSDIGESVLYAAMVVALLLARLVVRLPMNSLLQSAFPRSRSQLG